MGKLYNENLKIIISNIDIMVFKPAYKKRVYKKYPTANSKALAMVKSLSKKIAGEVKVSDTIMNDQISWAGEVWCLNAIDQGNLIYQRDGQQIRTKYVTIKGRTVMNTSVSSTTMRFILFIDTTNTATEPPFTSLLQTTSTIDTPYSNRNLAQLARFKILKQFNVVMNNTGPSAKEINIYVKNSSLVKFMGNTASAGAQYFLYLGVISDISGAGNTPNWVGVSRYGYYDN